MLGTSVYFPPSLKAFALGFRYLVVYSPAPAWIYTVKSQYPVNGSRPLYALRMSGASRFY